MKRPFLALVAILYLLAFLVPIVVRPLSVADEARYAEIPREMVASGDWVVPHLNGLRYFEKPPLGYWLVALSFKVFGENHAAARLPSALAAGLTSLLMFWLIRRQASDLDWARLTVLIHLTCLLVFVVGATIVLDGVFTLFLTGAMAFFFAYDQEVRSVRQTGFLVLFGLCCGLAFLTKGLLAGVVPAIVIGPYLVWSRNWKGLFHFPALPIGAAIAVILPWAVAIHLREPDFWRYFIVEEHFRRFAGQDAQHPEPVWFFVKFLALGMLPWVFVVPAAIRGGHRHLFQEPLARYAFCWAVMPFLFFSASSGKLGTYILPCFPPLALMLARGLTRYGEKARHTAFNRGTALLALVVLGGALTITVIQLAPGIEDRIYAERETRDWVVLVCAMVAWAALLIASVRMVSPARKIACFAASPVLLYCVASFCLPYQVKAARSAEAFLAEHAHRIPADSIVVGDNKRTHPACWFLKRDDLYVLGHGEFRYGLSYPEARHRTLDPTSLNHLITHNPGTHPVTLLTVRDRWEPIAHLLPKPSFLSLEDPADDPRALTLVQFN